MIRGGHSTVMSRMTTRRCSLDRDFPISAADGRAGPRHARALHILVLAAQREGVLTLQAPGEFVHAAQRTPDAPPRDAAAQGSNLPAAARPRTPAGASAP